MLDIARIRADTPSADDQIFLMSAGSSLMPQPVIKAMQAYLDLEERMGGYKAYESEEQRIASGYDSAAALIGARPDEIAFMESATAAWQMAFYSMPFEAGDIVLTSEAEYGANYVALLQLRRRLGIEIQVVPSDEAGEIDLDALRRMITPRVRLISLTWIPTNGGLTNPAAEVGRLARDHGIAYLLDACQAVGQLPVDVQTLGCDMLSATGRKFLRGPRGTGFLYVRKGFISRLEPHTIDHFSALWVDRDRFELRDDARRYETWESNYVARAGLIAAMDYALNIGMGNIAIRCSALANRLRDGLAELPGVQVYDLGRNPSAIVSFTVGARPAEEIVTLAGEARIVIGTTPPSSTRLDAERRHLPALIRASPHYFNTQEEIDKTLDFFRAL
ncbi:aminotransferase class V-fold PLP-dependent enzyme [Candidimonas sp. SYP-B2681]|uniref:aminotransferase class V-fold PLP-dependent enzyme n=1 Tax=Candidimonas sp. SYP-B2681 TaxID=2497686 RepID=UPI000F85C87E|nr:aminotransferase class V-fold PLP-dependent enzyme [Candidimonas sp. SYP-B2681]RTZ42566.1 aminotransferase class V-fold PLP-dependent enzyme [Candidimonas sp. SYP-B2681]